LRDVVLGQASESGLSVKEKEVSGEESGHDHGAGDATRSVRSGDSLVSGGASPFAFEESSSGEPPLKVISARGTEDGLVLRIDGRAEWMEILGEIEAFFGSRRRFFEGGQVKVEWLERLPTKEQSGELESHLEANYGISILARRKRPSRTTITVERGPNERASGEKGSEPRPDARGESRTAKKDRRGVTVSLFESVGVTDPAGRDVVGPNAGAPAASAGDSLMPSGSDIFALAERLASDRPGDIDAAAVLSIDGDVPGSVRRYTNRISHILGDDLQFEEDANAKLVFGTLRSGQRIETPFSLVVVGDVNPGADLVAGGDIFVLGSIRGTAHAGAYDDECQDRIVFALQMQPMQLRIGSVISRGSADTANNPEVARVENRRIIVEAFNPRAAYGKKFR